MVKFLLLASLSGFFTTQTIASMNKNAKVEKSSGVISLVK